jgi:hypothetical protein
VAGGTGGGGEDNSGSLSLELRPELPRNVPVRILVLSDPLGSRHQESEVLKAGWMVWAPNEPSQSGAWLR